MSKPVNCKTLDRLWNGNTSPEFVHEVEKEKFVLDVTEALWAMMDKHRISKAALADKLGKSRSHVTQLLNGDRNMTLRTLFDIAAALECKPRFTLAPAHEQIASVQYTNSDNSQHWLSLTSIIESPAEYAQEIRDEQSDYRPALTA